HLPGRSGPAIRRCQKPRSRCRGRACASVHNRSPADPEYQQMKRRRNREPAQRQAMFSWRVQLSDFSARTQLLKCDYNGGAAATLLVATSETVMVNVKITRITRSEIEFGMGRRSARIIFVPTKKRMSARPVLR